MGTIHTGKTCGGKSRVGAGVRDRKKKLALQNIWPLNRGPEGRAHRLFPGVGAYERAWRRQKKDRSMASLNKCAPAVGNCKNKASGCIGKSKKAHPLPTSADPVSFALPVSI